MTPREIVRRDAAVLWFYGIGCDPREIGPMLGISPERAKQIVRRDRPGGGLERFFRLGRPKIEWSAPTTPRAYAVVSREAISGSALNSGVPA